MCESASICHLLQPTGKPSGKVGPSPLKYGLFPRATAFINVPAICSVFIVSSRACNLNHVALMFKISTRSRFCSLSAQSSGSSYICVCEAYSDIIAFRNARASTALLYASPGNGTRIQRLRAGLSSPDSVKMEEGQFHTGEFQQRNAFRSACPVIPPESFAQPRQYGSHHKVGAQKWFGMDWQHLDRCQVSIYRGCGLPT